MGVNDQRVVAPPSHRYYLPFVDEPLPAIEYQRWRAQPERVRLPASNRMQRTLYSRLPRGCEPVP